MKSIMIIYHSQQAGNTKKLAELVKDGIAQAGSFDVRMVNTNEQRVDMGEVEKSDGLAIGSPDYFTYVAGGLKQFFDDAMIAHRAGKQIKGKPYVGFLTHGGGGGAIQSLERLAGSFEFKKAAEPVVCKGAPEGDAVAAGVELGKALAGVLLGER